LPSYDAPRRRAQTHELTGRRVDVLHQDAPFRGIDSDCVHDKLLPILRRPSIDKWRASSVAYDIVDERPHRDIDSEGLLLIALEVHGITRVEVDARLIESEPHASNCKRIWRHRDVEVGADLHVKINGALEARRLSVRGLGRATKMRSAMATVCALICRRVLYTELSTAFGPASWVARRSDRGNGPSPSEARKTPPESVRVLSGEAKR
jgi:hypothetical protein